LEHIAETLKRPATSLSISSVYVVDEANRYGEALRAAQFQASQFAAI
jgi:hypothetical protein